MQRFFWVCIGSGLGGGARYLVSGWVLRAFGSAFPFGTLAVNIVGSFLLSALMFAGVEASLLSPNVRLALTTGAMGGFTTYSTFSYETLKYLQNRAWGMAVTDVLVTVLSCIAAGMIGWSSAKWLLGS